MRYVGVDYSVNSPAIVVDGREHGEGVSALLFSTAKRGRGLMTVELPDGTPFHMTEVAKPEWDHPVERHVEKAKIILSHIPDECAGLIEGYALGSSGGRVFDIAEACMAFKTLAFVRRGLVFDVQTPQKIKIHATGRGNATKDDMAEAFKEQAGFCMHEYLGKKKADSSPCSDVVDAWFAAGLCRSSLGA